MLTDYSSGSEEYLYVLVAYVDEDTIKYLVWPISHEPSKDEMAHLEPGLECEHFYPYNPHRLDYFLDAHIHCDYGNNIYIHWRDKLVTFYDEQREEAEIKPKLPLASSMLAAGVVKDRLYVITDTGKVFRTSQINIASQLPISRYDVPELMRENVSDDNLHAYAKILLKLLHSHMHDGHITVYF